MTGSITNWLTAYKAGDRDAAELLWARYYERLVSLARKQLSSAKPGRLTDEEDIALSAFSAFCTGLEAGRYPTLADRDGLWRLLVDITIKKILNSHRRESRKKRRNTSVSIEAVEDIAGEEPSPEFCVQAMESLAELLRLLNDAQLAQIAIWRMEGYNNHDIARLLGCSVNTVVRKVRRIRHEWSHLSEHGELGE
jgi:RNA polymerase sigma factor (sigma-70 family)